MNWKYEAIAKLKDYDAHQQALTNIPEEMKRLEGNFASIRSSRTDATPMRGGSNAREDALLSNIVHRDELKAQYEDAKLWVSTVDRALDVLSDEDRLVLDRFYMHPAKGNVERLCEELGLEKTAVYGRRNNALRSVIIALYSVTEI